MDKPKQVELIVLMIRHLKGVISTLEKYLECIKEEPDAKAR